VANKDIKASFKKYLLAFSFLISFFMLSGYVSHSAPGGNRVSGTELFTDKSFVLKGGISYKRAALTSHVDALSYAAYRKHTDQGINIDNKLALTRYRYLSRLFLSAKHHFAYSIDHLYHTADQYDDTTSSRIG
jgi:hypothetical protein